jgi:hypothetical protein
MFRKGELVKALGEALGIARKKSLKKSPVWGPNLPLPEHKRRQEDFFQRFSW